QNACPDSSPDSFTGVSTVSTVSTCSDSSDCSDCSDSSLGVSTESGQAPIGLCRHAAPLPFDSEIVRCPDDGAFIDTVAFAFLKDRSSRMPVAIYQRSGD